VTAIHLSRRQALVMVGAGFVASGAMAASVRPKLGDPSAPYQAPGGRIGFTRPQGVAPSTNGWILQSDDHTFQVRVQETLAVSGMANVLWDKDKTSTLTGSPQIAGFSARRFKDRRFEPSLDYGQDTIVIAHADWIGEVSVTTSDLSDQAETMEAAANAAGQVQFAGGSGPTAAGLVARWREATDLVLGSITVRDAPPVGVAMAEFGAALDTAGLHPRFAGDRLILSARGPRTPTEALGTGLAHITLPSMSNLDYIAEDANTEMFEFFRMTGTELSGGACRGFQGEEKSAPGGQFATSVRVFGRRRQQEITAVYPAVERGATLEALGRTFRSLRFVDEG